MSQKANVGTYKYAVDALDSLHGHLLAGWTPHAGTLKRRIMRVLARMGGLLNGFKMWLETLPQSEDRDILIDAVNALMDPTRGETEEDERDTINVDNPVPRPSVAEPVPADHAGLIQSIHEGNG